MADEDLRTNSPGSSATENIKSEATEQAARLAGSVKDEAKRYEKDLRSGIAERAESVAAGLRKAGSEIDPDSTISTLFERAADSVTSLADSLNSTDPRQMVDEVRDFARRQPGAFLGLTALAGFAAARFLRAGSPTSSNATERSRTRSFDISRSASSKDGARASPMNNDAQAGDKAAADRPISTDPVPASGNRGDGGSHA